MAEAGGAGVKATIICGFPGVGKSSCRYDKDGNSHSNVWDMESSAYSWIFDSFNPKDYPKRNPSFPKNYIDSLEKLLEYGGYEYIFLSCHDVVRDELRKRGIKYIIVAPKNTPEIKNEYCKRYLKRGSDVDLITKIYSDWDEMIESIKADPSPCIWLDSGEFLADVLSKEGE